MTKYLQTGTKFSIIEEDFKIHENFPVGVYNLLLQKGMSGTSWNLEKFSDKFTFPYKLYDLENEFIDHVVKTYQNTTGNFGIIFTGIKGTGKSVTAKIISNLLNLPVIIITNMGDDNELMINFIANSLRFDCIIFIDEFEKQFDSDDDTILKLTDSVYNSKYRKMFLLTTNELEINSNLIGRPSRIRYIKRFGNLKLDTIKSYLNDNLKNKDLTEDIINFIDQLRISTIDILKVLVEEVNIHNDLSEVKKFINVENSTYNYSAVRGYFDCDDNIETTVLEFINDVKKFNKKEDISNSKFDIKLSTFKSNKSFHQLKIGDENLFRDYYNEKIVYINRQLACIVTRDLNNTITFYYISNPDVKPSLYSDSSLIY